jgi:thioredoxin reductase (NADPH)
MSIKTMTTEILIVGAGAAGLTAGLYTARAGRRTLIVKGRTGASRLDIGYELENYPGFPSIDSRELRAKFLDHARRFGAEVIAGDVIAMSLDSNPKYVTTKDSFIEAKAVIIAMGKPFAKERSFPGEEAFIGLGVSYCATCDGPLYRGADVLAYGHSEEAIEDVLALAQMGCRVRWLPGAKQDKVPAALIERVTKAGVPVLWETKVKSLEGEGRLQKVVLERGGDVENAAVAGLFIFREVPTGPLFSKAGLKLDHKGCIAVDRRQRTNLAGVFAAGDVTCGALQVVAAAGEGCAAALQALAYLRS